LCWTVSLVLRGKIYRAIQLFFFFCPDEELSRLLKTEAAFWGRRTISIRAIEQLRPYYFSLGFPQCSHNPGD
jgi:hypothetical protein